eukprot:scaffold11103_cov117-Cylindrotheca_fusiformis.AAC.8
MPSWWFWLPSVALSQRKAWITMVLWNIVSRTAEDLAPSSPFAHRLHCSRSYAGHVLAWIRLFWYPMMMMIYEHHIGQVHVGLWHDAHYQQAMENGIDLIPDRIINLQKKKTGTEKLEY